MSNQVTFVILLLLTRLAFAQDGSRNVVICNGLTVKLKAQSAGAYGYEWRKDNQIIPGSSGNELVVSEEGNYSVFAYNSVGCLSDESIVITLEYRKPVAVDDIVAGKPNEPVTINVLLNDIGSCSALETTSVSLQSASVYGNVSVDGSSITYLPSNNFNDKEEIKYTVMDLGGQQSNVATVTFDYSKPLPVTLSAFTVSKRETSTILSWTTTSENNSFSFIVERSIDGKTWTAISSQAAKGNTSQIETYHDTDTMPESGVNYYRLKMIDKDGSFAYSQIKSVHFPEFAWATLYPNPVNHTLHIQIRNKQVRKLRLVELTGKTLFQTPVSTSAMVLNMKPYSSGSFLIYLEQENGLVSIFKIFHE